jgi:hypothetical protein
VRSASSPSAGGLALMLLQGPFFGWIVGIAFDQKTEDRTIDFVLALIAVWFGCFNACREVVKERLIFLRERRTGVPVRAYVLSKLLVLASIAAVQDLALVVLVARVVDMKGALPLVYLTLFATSLAGTALGLLLSSIVRSQNTAVALVPIALVPQLIFSDVVIANPNELVDKIEWPMFAQRCLKVLIQLQQSSPAWGEVAQHLFVLGGLSVALLGLAGLCLRLQEE